MKRLLILSALLLALVSATYAGHGTWYADQGMKHTDYALCLIGGKK